MKIRMLQAVAGAGFSLHEDQILDSSIVGDELANAWLKDGIAVEDGATETALRNRIAERFGVQEVAIDRWNSTAVSVRLQEEGFTVAQFGQGFASMAAPVRELKRAIMAGDFRHGGNPILRMCVANVAAERDAAENEKFTKERARGRIDGAVASAMAIGRILASDEGPSVYATGERPDGFIVI